MFYMIKMWIDNKYKTVDINDRETDRYFSFYFNIFRHLRGGLAPLSVGISSSRSGRGLPGWTGRLELTDPPEPHFLPRQGTAEFFFRQEAPTHCPITRDNLLYLKSADCGLLEKHLEGCTWVFHEITGHHRLAQLTPKTSVQVRSLGVTEDWHIRGAQCPQLPHLLGQPRSDFDFFIVYFYYDSDQLCFFLFS